MSDAITSTKLEQTGEIFWDSRCCLSSWVGYLRFEPGAWKWNEGLPCLCADCKIFISLILFKLSHIILDWTALSWNLGGGGETFLEGSVNHIICRDHIVNLRSFIYRSLACGAVGQGCSFSLSSSSLGWRSTHHSLSVMVESLFT